MPIVYLGISGAISIYVDITKAYKNAVLITMVESTHTHRRWRNRQVMTQIMPILCRLWQWLCQYYADDNDSHSQTLMQMIMILISTPYPLIATALHRGKGSTLSLARF